MVSQLGMYVRHRTVPALLPAARNRSSDMPLLESLSVPQRVTEEKEKPQEPWARLDRLAAQRPLLGQVDEGR